MTEPTKPTKLEQPEGNQQQFLAVPINLMAAALKILSTLPYEQVSAIIPQLSNCHQITATIPEGDQSK